MLFQLSAIWNMVCCDTFCLITFTGFERFSVIWWCWPGSIDLHWTNIPTNMTLFHCFLVVRSHDGAIVNLKFLSMKTYPFIEKNGQFSQLIAHSLTYCWSRHFLLLIKTTESLITRCKLPLTVLSAVDNCFSQCDGSPLLLQKTWQKV